MNMVKERDYSVDEVALKKYFPLATVKSGILRLYQQLLGLRFERVSNAEVWHEEVEMVSLQIWYIDSSVWSRLYCFISRANGIVLDFPN